MGHVVSSQGAVLQIPLHGVHFRHRITDGRAGGKDHAAPSGQFVHVTAFQKHIRRFLCLAGGKTRDISHFRRQKEVFVSVCFVYKKPIHAQFLKGNNIVLPLFRLQFSQAAFQLLLGSFHLFDRELLPTHEFQFLDALGDLLDLLLQKILLPSL